MIFITGGLGQGKLNYVFEKSGLTEANVAVKPEDVEQKLILAGVETWLKNHPGRAGVIETAVMKNPDLIVICGEVGCGVVPIAPEERAWREEVGRLCCRLAERADRVERIFCGLGMVLKGEGTWN